METDGIPTVALFAEQLNMSVKSLGDKLRGLTGKTAQEHINLKLIERAKVLLLQKSSLFLKLPTRWALSIRSILVDFFKKRVGMSPKAFQRFN